MGIESRLDEYDKFPISTPENCSYSEVKFTWNKEYLLELLFQIIAHLHHFM